MKHLEETVKLLNYIHDNPESTQREIVEKFNFSLGKVNYLMQALTKKGTIKLKRFKNSRKKTAYLYILTPKGIREKTEITKMFLKERLEEYDKLKDEIQSLTLKLKNSSTNQD